jgi:hypothetical protein
MSSKSTPIKTVGKRKDVPLTPTNTTGSPGSAASHSPTKVRKQAPIDLQIFFYNLVAIAVVAGHAYPL